MLTMFGTSLTSMAQDSIRLSLKDAIEIALEKNRDVEVAADQTASAQYSIREASGNFLPKVTINGIYTRNVDKQVIFLPEQFGFGGPTRIGSDNNFSSSLDLTLPIYSRSNNTGKQYAHGNLVLQQEVLRGIRLTTVLNVKKTYFSYMVSLATVQVRQKGVENAFENLQNIQDKLAQGVATEFDETSAKVKLATAKNNLLEAETNVVPLADRLKVLLGLPVVTSITPIDSLTLDEKELFAGEGMDDQLSNNSTQKQMELKTVLAGRQAATVRTGFFPTLTAFGSYQLQSQQNDFNFSEYNWVKTSNVGLKFSYPLFNGTVTRYKLQQALLAEKIAKTQLQLAVDNNQAQYQQLISQLDFSKRRILLQLDNIRLAEKALSLVKERYQYGKGTFLEVSNAEMEYTTAKLNYLQAILDYKSACFDYELLTGKEN